MSELFDSFFQWIGILAVAVAVVCAVDSRALLVLACTAAAIRDAKSAFAKAYMESWRKRWNTEKQAAENQDFPQQQQHAEYSGSGGTL